MRGSRFRNADQRPLASRSRRSMGGMANHPLTDVADILSCWPGLVTRRIHVSGPDGRCSGCRSQVRPAPVWPCRFATIADAARHPTERQ